MAATLTWLDLTASDRDRMRQVLDLFKEQGTVDEMGLGRLRDALSEALFPGPCTSGPNSIPRTPRCATW